jgi:Fe-S cluster assembly protein SufD
MNANNDQRQWFIDLANQAAGPGRMAGNQLQTIDLPNRKQEAWRYTDLTRLYQQMFVAADALPSAVAFDDWVYAQDSAYRLVLVNGRFDPQLSYLPENEAVTLVAISQLNDGQRAFCQDYLAHSHEFNQDAFDELNRAITHDGYLLQVAANTRVDHPIEVLYLNQPGERSALAATRSLIVLESGAEATVLEHFTGDHDTVYFHNGLTRVELKNNARLTHHRLQDDSRKAYHLHRVYLSQQASSHYQGFSLSSGADWSRADSVVNLDGEGAECHLRGIYTITDRQYNDMHLDVRHLKPHCRSSERFNGVLAGAGRAVFDGRILIEQDAQKSDAALSNRNLLLAESAEIDTKPQLEIYADDVKASHGTTVGRIDPDQLFYCKARGISEDKAMHLLCLGFAEQVTRDIEDEALLAAVHQRIDGVLDKAGR